MRYHVLIAEDERVTRQTIEASLKKILPESFFIIAENGGQAVNFSEQAIALDIAFLDVRMPILDGIEVAKTIRRRWQNCQIIFLTAYSDYEYMHEAIGLQAADYLLKPFSQTGLAVSVQKALKKMEPRDNLRKRAVSPEKDKQPEGVPSWVKGKAVSDFSSGAAAVLKCPPRLAVPRVVGMLQGDDWRPHQDLFFRQEQDMIRVVLISPAKEDVSAELMQHLGELAEKLKKITGAAPFGAVSGNVSFPSAINEALEQCRRCLEACSSIRPVVSSEMVKQQSEASDERRSGDNGARNKRSGDRECMEAWMAEHFQEEINLEQAAARLGYSRTYFSKWFKNTFGENFITYLTALRMEHAKELLVQNGQEIQEVGRQSGFQDAAYFTNVFRRVTGETPSQYRERKIGK